MRKDVMIITIILLLFIGGSMVLAIPLKPDGSIDWDYINAHGVGGTASSSTPSGVIDKDIETITNCYNVSIHYSRSSGNYTPIYFKGCTDQGSNTWTCNCKDNLVNGEYHVILQTDGSNWDKERDYKFTIDYSYYDISNAENTFTVRDWGDTYDVYGNDVTDMGKSVVVVEKPIYVNQTVYKDKIIERQVNISVPVDRPVYVDKYIENTTITAGLRADLADAQSGNTFKTIILIISLVVNAGLIFFLIRKNNEDNGFIGDTGV